MKETLNVDVIERKFEYVPLLHSFNISISLLIDSPLQSGEEKEEYVISLLLLFCVINIFAKGMHTES